jgi:hypothetical protein
VTKSDIIKKYIQQFCGCCMFIGALPELGRTRGTLLCVQNVFIFQPYLGCGGPDFHK